LAAWPFGRRAPNGADRHRLERWLNDVTHEVHRQLDDERMVAACTAALHRILRPRQTNFWLGGPDEGLKPADGANRHLDAPAQASKVVLDCAGRRRTIRTEDELAVPVLTPRSALLGVVHLQGLENAQSNAWFVEAVTRELGVALERASLYRDAIAEKEKTEAILARIGDCVMVTDTGGSVVQWNAAAERIVGCPRERAIGRNCNSVLGLRVGEHELDCSKGCALLGSRDATADLRGQEAWRLRDGERRQPLLATAAVVRDRDGKVSEVVHSFRDITRLKEADEAKTLFLATASHELKTPLTVIQGFTESLAGSPGHGEQEKRALDAVHRRAIELNGIVDRILLSSRIEAGRAKVSPEEVPLGDILEERVSALRSARGREVTMEVEQLLPNVIADRAGLITVLDHLLDNAVKYSPDGGPVGLSAASEDLCVVLGVSDEGIGMDPEQAARCFDKFWQAESSDVRRFGGTGIGLYIVKSLVDAMGGTIAVETEVGAGTTFRVSLLRAGAPITELTEEEVVVVPGEGDPSVIREFMRQIGVPSRR
jgi:PAS domain S-box-containing protein